MKTIVIIVKNAARAAEALRAAVGLTLRGDRVAVLAEFAWPDGDAVQKCLALLRSAGHAVDAPFAVVRGADAVEVWS